MAAVILLSISALGSAYRQLEGAYLGERYLGYLGHIDGIIQ